MPQNLTKTVKCKPQRDFKALSIELLRSPQGLLFEMFPSGKTKGKEFTIGSLNGEEGRSLSINMYTGIWRDFATDDSGGDLISLYAARNNISQIEAFDQLSNDKTYFKPQSKSVKPKTTQTIYTAHPAPEGDLPKDISKADDYWLYKNNKSEVLMVPLRFNKPNGDKTIVPYIYDKKTWTSHWPSHNRILFNSDLISQNPQAPILIVEGEKAAVAAQKFSGHYIPTTWAAGCNAWKQTDWSPLKGKKVLLWPDQDLKVDEKTKLLLPYEEQAGTKSMNKLSKYLLTICSEVILINVENSSSINGWDAADANFKSQELFYNWAGSRSKALEVTKCLQI